MASRLLIIVWWSVMTAQAMDSVRIIVPADAGFRTAGMVLGQAAGIFAEHGIQAVISEDDCYGPEPWFALRRIAMPVAWAAGEDIALVAVIQQRNPDVVLVREVSPFRSLSQAWQDPGSRISGWEDSADGTALLHLAATLRALGLDAQRLRERPRQANHREQLLDGSMDVLCGSSPVDMGWFSAQGARVRSLSLGFIGDRLHGDSLVCSGTTFRNRPDLVERMRTAVLRGWESTLRDVDGAIATIVSTSAGTDADRTTLRLRLEQEAPHALALLDASVVPLGSITLDRLHAIQGVFASAHIPALVRPDLVYQAPSFLARWGLVLVVIAGMGTALIAGLVVLTQRQHRDLTENQAHFRNLVDLAVGYLAFRILITPGRFVPELASPSIIDCFGHPLTRYQREPSLFLAQLTDASRRALLRAIEREVRLGRPLRLEITLRHPDGSERQFLVHGRPSTSDRGLILDGICLDLTAELRAQQESRHLQHQLELAHRHESLGLLAGGVAHDFNNILGAIRGNAELLRPVVDDQAIMAKRLDRVLMAVDRAAGLVRQILAYAGSGAIEPRPLDLAEEIRQITTLLQHGLPTGVRIELALAEQMPPVVFDQIQFQQVVINLIMNAAESYEDQAGIVTVSLNPDGPRDVLLRVTDLGCGMDAATMERMWEPYFTTKERGHGLGLAAVRGIIDNAGGHLDCRSSPGKGTTFAIGLPTVAPTQRRTTGVRERIATDPDDQGVILIVDDDPLIRETIEAMVHDLGFQTATASGGHEGIDRLKVLGKRCTTLLLDCRMPGLDGPATLQLIRQDHPDLPVLLVSGYERDEVLRAGLADDPWTRFLGKPFTANQLTSALDHVRSNDDSVSTLIPPALTQRNESLAPPTS